VGHLTIIILFAQLVRGYEAGHGRDIDRVAVAAP
jgi:hypothetical protein